MERPVAFVWENLGPSHHDRLRAVHRSGRGVVAVQLFDRSSVYDWEGAAKPGYPVVTLAGSIQSVGAPVLAWRIFRAVRASGARQVFMCHYHMAAVFLAACLLRCAGCRVYTMVDSKFDDGHRHWRTTPLKALALLPYRGALVASRRSRDYAAYLGLAAERIAFGYDTLDLARLRAEGKAADADFAGRPFLAVARLVELKNLSQAIAAFARYRLDHGGTRHLRIVGEGPQEDALRRQAGELGIAEAIEFVGSQPRARVTETMRGAFALILPSLRETFGFVVLEAMAMGLPTIVSHQAGAVDLLVDNLVSGFVIDPRDEAQLLAAMLMLDRDPALHASMGAAALVASERGDVRHFVAGVEQLMRR